MAPRIPLPFLSAGFLDFFSILFGHKGLGRGLLWRSGSGLSPGDETAALLSASTAGASRPLHLRIESEAVFLDAIAVLALPTRQTQYIITRQNQTLTEGSFITMTSSCAERRMLCCDCEGRGGGGIELATGAASSSANSTSSSSSSGGWLRTSKRRPNSKIVLWQ
jgi:hypothetical protein